jgi:hypothetical protein
VKRRLPMARTRRCGAARLYPRDSGQSLDLSQDLEMSAAFSDLLAVRQVIATHEELEAQLKQRIQQRMGEASQAMFEGGDVSWKRSKDSVVLDTAVCSRSSRSCLQQYALARPGSRRVPGQCLIQSGSHGLSSGRPGVDSLRND